MTAPVVLAAKIDAAIRSLPAATTAEVRAVRRRFSRDLDREEAGFVVAVAWALIRAHQRRWVAYELIRFHPGAFAAAGPHVPAMAGGLSAWDQVDAFGRILAGPAWLRGLIGDDQFARWAASPDRWTRRLALVATVALNAKTDGGEGDIARTLGICRRLLADRDDMVDKAMSWALRELAAREPEAVRAFLAEGGSRVSARVRREVTRKLVTGLKAPRRRS